MTSVFVRRSVRRRGSGRFIAAAAFAGTAAGYVGYDSMHWWLHHGRAKSRAGRWLKRYHLQHNHHRNLGRFGVSTPFWDLVFDTYVPTRRPAAPATTRSRARAMGRAIN